MFQLWGFFILLNLPLNPTTFHSNIPCKSVKTNSAALCPVQWDELSSYKLSPPGRVRHISPFLLLEQQWPEKYTTNTPASLVLAENTSLLMATHHHASSSVVWGSLQNITIAINQACTQIPGTCCRQDTLRLLLLDLPTLAALCIQISAYGCVIHALN